MTSPTVETDKVAIKAIEKHCLCGSKHFKIVFFQIHFIFGADDGMTTRFPQTESPNKVSLKKYQIYFNISVPTKPILAF